MYHILLAAQPTALLTDVPTPDQPLGQGVISTLAYFVLSMAIFGIGFIVQDLLTPGKFRKQVFVDVLAAAISTSPTDLVQGLIATAVYGTVGLVLQTIFLVLLEWLNPEKFRYVVEDTKLRPSVLLSGIILIVVGVINAACLL